MPDRLIPAETELLGQRIAGKYQLVQILASGAFGTVFTAHHYFCNHFVRPVAVKVSRQTGLTEANAPYLFSDALVLAQLMSGTEPDGKEHLIPIYDMGLLPEHRGRGYLVMELVDGSPLLSHIQAAGRIGVASGLRYLKEMCQALALVHSKGAVHRDLKPDNILVDRSGVIRLVDFGLASFTDPTRGFAPGSMGTFTYMAPETMLGHSTAAADVYGIGLVAYELFTGGGPHLTAVWPQPRGPEDVEDHVRLKTGLVYPPPSEFHNEIRNDFPWIDELVARCLQPHPRKRYQHAGEVLSAIEAGLAGSSLPAPGESAADPELPSFFDRMENAAPARSDSPLIRDSRRLLARKQFAQVIDALDIHRPAEWTVVDAEGARVLRLLAQAYLGTEEIRNAMECLEQLRNVQKEEKLLPKREFQAAMTDLHRCCTLLQQDQPAALCRELLEELGS